MKHPFSLYALAVMMTAIGAWCAAWWVIPAAITAAASAPYVLAAVAMTLAVTAIPLAVRDGNIDDEFDAALASKKRWAHHVEYVDGLPFLVGDDWERPATPEFKPFEAFEPPPYTPEALQQVLGYESWGAPEYLPDPAFTQVIAQDLSGEDDWELISQWAEAPTIHAPIPQAPAIDWSGLEDKASDLELEVETLRMGVDSLQARLRDRDSEVKGLQARVAELQLYLQAVQQEVEENKTFAEFYRARCVRAEKLLKEKGDGGKEEALKHLGRALEASKTSEAMTPQEEYEQAALRG